MANIADGPSDYSDDPARPPTPGGPPLYEANPYEPAGVPPEGGAPEERRTAKKVGASAVLSAIGGLGMAVAFFVPMVNTAAFFRDAGKDFLKDLDFAMVVGEVVVEADQREEFRASREICEALDLPGLSREVERAKNREELERVYTSHGVSAWRLSRAFQIYDRKAEVIHAKKDTRAGVRIFWMSGAWVFLAGAVAFLLALARLFKPLNAFQVAWNGTLGLLMLGVAALLFAGCFQTERVSGIDVPVVQLRAAVLFGFGALITWISAFAGLSKRNWWKAPLLGILLLIVMAASIAAPAMMAAK